MIAMIDREFALQFAAAWVAAWNAHDLDQVLAHYAEDFEMRSPLIVERLGIAAGALRGKAAVRSYWQRGLDATPGLRFELREVFVGVDTIALCYHSITLGRTVAEVLTFNARRQVIAAAALHGAPAHRPVDRAPPFPQSPQR